MFDLVCTRAPLKPDQPDEDDNNQTEEDLEDNQGQKVDPEKESGDGLEETVDEGIRIVEGDDSSEISELYWLIPVISIVPLFLCLFVGYKIWQRLKYKNELAQQKE